jgi:hypothetical protein
MRTLPANPWWKRWQRHWRRLRGFDGVKTHQVDWVWDEGVRYKRVIFQDLTQARAVIAALEALQHSGCFPALVRHEHATLWMSYVEQTPSTHPRSYLFANFFHDLYTDPGQPQAWVDSKVFLDGLYQDIKKLREQFRFSERLCDQLQRAAVAQAPRVVLCGFDYVDAVAKNFVVNADRALGIDVEALLADQGLGWGLAKAQYRALLNPADDLFPRLGNHALLKQYPFVRLCFVAQYARQKFEQGKRRHIHTDIIESWSRL